MNNQLPSRAVIFDLDGVLVESESLKAKAHSAAVAELGGRVPPSYYSHVMGASHEFVRAAFIREANLTVAPQRYSSLYHGIYERMLEDLQVTAGARELVVALGDRDYRLAVATSSQPWMVDRILRQTGLGGHFQAVVTAADVERHKPAPDAYLQALDRLGVTAAEATVIEDSESGVSAAVAAEIPTLARRHETNRRHDLTKAEVVLDSLRQTDQILQRIDEIISRSGA